MTVPEFLVDLVKEHSGEMLILSLALVIVITLLIVLPQLLRANLRKSELIHEEHLRALEKGLPIPIQDDRARMAARTALLVPMVVMIATGTVTSFIVVYKSENLFAVVSQEAMAIEPSGRGSLLVCVSRLMGKSLVRTSSISLC